MGKQLPKNVRQIGNVSDSTKIYVEDYVDTFFNQLCDKAEQDMQGAFLVGETVQGEEQNYIYVYGAIRMKELGMKGKDFIISEQVWKDACETCKEYFGNAEILGWFITGGEHPLEINHNINRVHQRYFSRENSIFITKSTRDREEKFYVHKYRDMLECGGHYIYYEKNVEMQNYMIATRKKVGLTPGELIEDRVTKSFRSIIREKNEKSGQKNHPRMVYAVSTFLVMIIIIIGITMLNNYDGMKEVQNRMDALSNQKAKMEQDKEKKDREDEDKAVKTMGNNVTSEVQGKEQDKPNPKDNEEPKKDEPTATASKKDEPTATAPNTTQPVTQAPETTVQKTEQPPTPSKTYIVKEGDTLETISRKEYGNVSHVEAICKLNGLNDGNLILIGQKLLLP